MEQVNSDPTKAFEIGRYFTNIGEADKALSWLEKGLASQPRDERNYCAIIGLYRGHGLFEKGRLYGERAIAENPLNFDNYFCLAYLYVDLGSYDKALDILEKGWNDYPSFAPSPSIKLFAVKNIFQKIFMTEKGYTVRRSRVLALYHTIDAKAHGYLIDPTAPKRDEIPQLKSRQGFLRLFLGKINVSGWRKFDLEEIVKMARARHVPLFLQTYPNANFHGISEVAQESGVPLVDHFQIFNDMWQTGKVDRYDFFEAKVGTGGHCNAKGYGVLAENIFKKLVEEQIDGRL